MDPISVISGITGIVLSATKITKTLHDLYGSYSDAPATIKHLIHECYAINGALSQLQGWLCNEDPVARSKQCLIQLDLLVNTITAAMRSFEDLQAEVDKMTNLESKLVPIRYMWKEKEIEVILRQLQSHKTSLTLMLTILSSESDTQIRKTLSEMTAFMGVISKDQQRMWYTMRRQNILTPDGRSLLSRSNESVFINETDSLRSGIHESNTRYSTEISRKSFVFAFDHELKVSSPYRRQFFREQDNLNVNGEFSEIESILTVDDVTDILNLTLPYNGSKPSTIMEVDETSTSADETFETAADQQPVAVFMRRESTTTTTTTTTTGSRASRGSNSRSIISWFTTDDDVLSDWAKFWKLQSGDLVGTSENELARQRVIHEIIQTDVVFHRHLNIFSTVYRSSLRFFVGAGLTADHGLNSVLRCVFEGFDVLRSLHEEMLVIALNRAAEDGPWIQDISDIYCRWLLESRKAYLALAAPLVVAEVYISHAKEEQAIVQQYLERCSLDARARGIDWKTFLRSPIARLQRMNSLWSSVKAYTPPDTITSTNIVDLQGHIHQLVIQMDSSLEGLAVENFKTRLQVPDEHIKSQPSQSIHCGGDLVYAEVSPDPKIRKPYPVYMAIYGSSVVITERISRPRRNGPEIPSTGHLRLVHEHPETSYRLISKPIQLSSIVVVIDLEDEWIDYPSLTGPKRWSLSGLKGTRVDYPFAIGTTQLSTPRSPKVPGLAFDLYLFGTPSIGAKDAWISKICTTSGSPKRHMRMGSDTSSLLERLSRGG